MSNSKLISFDDKNLSRCLDYALGRVTEHENQRQLNKIALNAADLLKSDTNVVTRFFCQQKDWTQRSVENPDNEESELNAVKDVFVKEGEQLVLDNEEIYINDLLSDGEYPHLDDLFKFINDSEDGFNPTAAHYFTEIVSALLKKEPERILSYMYTRKHILDFLITNCDYQSIKNLLEKILNLNNEDGKSNINFKFFKHRLTLYNRLLREAGDLPNEALNNLMDIFINLLKEDENVVDSEYFVERLFEDASNFKRLVAQISEKQSPKLVELVELILSQVFKKDSDFWKSKQVEADDVKKSVSKKISSGQFEMEEAQNRIIEDNIEVEVQIEPMDEEKKENQATAETSNDAIKNLDLEAYDPDEVKRLDLITVLESGLPSIVSVLKNDGTVSSMHPDGSAIKLSSSYKMSITKLLKRITKMDYRSLKDILIDEDVLCLYLVS